MSRANRPLRSLRSNARGSLYALMAKSKGELGKHGRIGWNKKILEKKKKQEPYFKKF